MSINGFLFAIYPWKFAGPNAQLLVDRDCHRLCVFDANYILENVKLFTRRKVFSVETIFVEQASKGGTVLKLIAARKKSRAQGFLGRLCNILLYALRGLLLDRPTYYAILIATLISHLHSAFKFARGCKWFRGGQSLTYHSTYS